MLHCKWICPFDGTQIEAFYDFDLEHYIEVHEQVVHNITPVSAVQAAPVIRDRQLNVYARYAVRRLA